MKRIASGAFAFDATVPDGDGELHVTVVYVSSAAITAPEAGQLLAAHFEDASYPDQIWVLGMFDRADQIKALCDDDELKGRVPGVTRYHSTPDLVPYIVGNEGGVKAVDGTDLPDHVTQALFEEGLIAIFKEHNGMLDARAGFHYVKPSQRHSDRFLRTANVLLYGSEIEFMAATIMRRIGHREVRRLYTDTSSINSLALVLSDLLARATGRARATVDSFSSYHGLSSQFLIEPDEYTFALISASTSGGLVDTLESDRHLPRQQQLILYYVGSKLDPSLILQDLTAGHGRGYIEQFASWEPGECPLCDENQSTVIIDGDQFLPASPTVTGRMITTRDAPSWLGPFMKDVAGKAIITCRPTGRLFYFEISGALEGRAGGLSRALETGIQRHSPAATRWIVHMDDADSKAMADKIAKKLGELGVQIPQERVVSSKALTSGEHQPLGDGVALVVASIVVSGREILSVSRALRTLHDGEPIGYLLGLMRPTTEQAGKDLESNLTWGPRGKAFDFNAVQRIYIPSERDSESTPWEREAELLRRIADYLQEQSKSCIVEAQLQAVQNRLDFVTTAPLPELFLPGEWVGQEARLALRPNFAFWPFALADGVDGSQADVYFTMTAILHSLRSTQTGGAALHRDHNWTVLDPRNFSRFNDGVIQASLLRASLPHELDYSTDADLSHQMLGVLQGVFETGDPEEAAARSEFLLALCSGSVRLTPDDRREAAELIERAVPVTGSLMSVLAQATVRTLKPKA